MSLKDPGAFAHNAKYVIELLYDSTASLNKSLATPVDLSTAHRDDAGHFDGIAEPFRHWDAEGEVPSPCSRCHSSDGLALLLKEGAVIGQSPTDGFQCTTCHESLGGDWVRRTANDATFPSGATLTFGEGVDSNLCIECHQGRESTVSVDKALAGKPDDTVDSTIRFINVHYLAAGATLFGSEAQGAYQYAGKTYVGRNMHVDGFNQCVDCHDTHAGEVKVEQCAACHNSEDPQTFRMNAGDWDGDGDTTEGVYGEFETMYQALYAAMQKYTAETAGSPIVYSAGSYPYFFIDTNANGQPDADELTSDNGYKSWTPRLLRAAYNLQYATKDPGAFAHNGKYIVEILYDSLEDVGGSAAVTGMTRP